MEESKMENESAKSQQEAPLSEAKHSSVKEGKLIERSAIVFGAAVFVASVVGTVALNFFLDDLAVHVVGFVTTGDLGGKWNIRLIEYQRNVVASKKIVIDATANVRQLGSRVLFDFSTTGQRDREWTGEGYYNRPSLGLVYITSQKGGAGLGTFTLHEVPKGNEAFAGFTTGIECKGSDRILLTCPVLFLRVGNTVGSKYDSHLNADRCSEVPVNQICEPASKK